MRKALLYQLYENNKILCNLCAHSCELLNNQIGKCGVRKNINGILFSLNYGIIQGLALDPIEKKPFYHYMPGTKVLSFGSPGCNFTCKNCQNCDLSQDFDVNELNDMERREVDSLVREAEISPISGIAYTYSEPTIFFDFAYDLIQACRNNYSTQFLKHMFVSNGYFSEALLEKIIHERLLDAINIDLKFMSDDKYKTITGGDLRPVLRNIQSLYDSGIHLEIVNLVITDENDTKEDFELLAEFVKSVSEDIPLHINQFHPANKMQKTLKTPIETLTEAKAIAEKAGLKHIYIGNTGIENFSDTICPLCNHTLVKRIGQKVHKSFKKPDKNSIYCPNCYYKIDYFKT